MAIRAQASSGCRNTHRSTRPAYDNGYIQGSTAPKLRPQIAPKQETKSRKLLGSQPARSDHRIHRSQRHATYMDLPYAIMLTTASVFILYPCTNYLYMQSSIMAGMHHIEQIGAKLGQLGAENNALETNISTNTDLNKIYKVVIKELGMVYVRRDQILLYDKTESEHIRRYENISGH